MIDEHLFWSLQGPSAFLREIVETALETGAVAVQAPQWQPPGMMAAIVRALRARDLDPIYEVKNEATTSIVHRLAFATGQFRHSIRSPAGLLDAQFLRGTVFVVPAINSKEWTAWMSFFRTFIMDRRRRKGSVLLPVVVAVVPSDCPPTDVDRLFAGSVVRWRGRVSSFDMRTYVSARTGKTHSDNLLTRVASQLVVGLSGYDPVLAEFLCQLDPLSLIDPWDKLRQAYASLEHCHPHWGNGLVDRLDGEIFVHTSSLVTSGNKKDFDIRRWQSVSGPVLDFNAKVCRYFADLHATVLSTRLPFRVETPRGEMQIVHRYDMENKHLRDCLEDILERPEETFLRATNKARNNIAHNEVPEASLLASIANTWQNLNASVRRDHLAWDWPRREQQMTLLIGPAGGGKSTYAAANFAPDEIVSSDALRIELFGSQVVAGSQAKIFEVVRQRVIERLQRGDCVVVDATNMRQRDRLQLVDIMPPDLKVQYVVIDRTLQDKVRDGGWRNGREGLLEGHAETFALEINEILRGDGRDNVTVTDLRVASVFAA